MLLDYLFVERCRGCGIFLEYSTVGPVTICCRCFRGSLVEDAHIQPCRAGVLSLPVSSGATYSDVVKTMVFRLKYDHDRLVVRDLVMLLKKAYMSLIEQLPECRDAILIPIPLHFIRQFRRGYNQAELLANELGKLYQLDSCSRLLIRRKSTKDHHGLGKAQRQVNVSGAFALGPAKQIRQDQWLILVDDIYTSGATVAEAARVLRDGGYHRLACITVARAVLER